MTKKPTFTEQRAALDADLEDARDARDRAANRQHRELGEGSQLAIELTQPIRDFQGSVKYNLPDAPPEDERADRLAALTRELCEAIVERGVLLQPINTPTGYGLGIIDASVGEDVESARKAVADATRAVADFDRDHGDDLAEERKAARAAAYRKAVDDGDLDLADQLLRQRHEEDERTARQRTADALVSGEYEGWDADGQGDIRRSESAGTAAALTTADLAG